MKGETGVVMLAEVLSRNREGWNAMRCAAYIMGKYKPKSSEAILGRSFMIVAFNAEAMDLAQLDALIREQLVRPRAKNSPAMQVKDADRYASYMKSMKDTGTMILESTTLLFNPAMDMSGGDERPITSLTMSCEERDDLLSQAARIVGPPDTAFTASAMLARETLTKFQCRSSLTRQTPSPSN